MARGLNEGGESLYHQVTYGDDRGGCAINKVLGGDVSARGRGAIDRRELAQCLLSSF